MAEPQGGPSQLDPAALASCFWESTLAAVMIVDPETHTVVEANQVALDLMGRTRAQVIGCVCHLFVCPAEAGKCPITDLGQRIDHRERFLVAAGGRSVPILKSVREVVVGGRRLLVESFVNITDIKEAERALRESRQFIQTVVDGIGDPVLVIDPSSCRIVLANRAARELSPGRDLTAEGLTCHQVSHASEQPCDEEHGPCPLREVLATKRPTRLIHRHVTGEGQIVVEVLATPVVDERGAVTSVVESNRDVTLYQEAQEAIRHAKENLERQNEELRKIDRMKDALMGDVSHELKTPVAKHAMQLEILETLLRQLGVHDKVRDVLETMAAGVRRQQSVIRNILVLSRLESGRKELHRERVRLDGLLEEVLADYLDSIAAAGIRLEIALDEAYALADRDMLWHVFSNVVNNAIKYRAEQMPRIVVTLRREVGQARISVTDNGAGMTQQEIERAFERFYQATASAEGIGVGLSICRTILDRLGGGIDIGSPGRGLGTTVTVTLPAV